MGVLHDWGWGAVWAERFAPHARDGCFPARITVEHKGLYHFASEHGEGLAQVSGRLRHAAADRADFPAVGDWVAATAAADTGPARINRYGFMTICWSTNPWPRGDSRRQISTRRTTSPARP